MVATRTVPRRSRTRAPKLSESCPKAPDQGAGSAGPLTRVTQHYSIDGAVPFVDVHIEQDTELYLEPSAIRAAAEAGDPDAARADQRLTSFIHEVLDRPIGATGRTVGTFWHPCTNPTRPGWD